jgi:hypothetical protein
MDERSSLPPVWIVGFTGHRRLREPDKIGALLRELLHSLGNEIPGQLVGHSSIAIGGDTLFAEACLASNVPWFALLPLAEGDFKSDFSETDWNKARQLLQKAARVESLVGAKDRNVAYLECGLATVEEADIMIAVWDGEPSRGTGGTAEVIAHARTFGRPLILIHPERLTAERESFAAKSFSDPEMEYLNRLPDYAQPDSAPSAQLDDERVCRFFAKVDAQAARIAPRFRRWVAASVIMNALAAILTAAAVGFGIRSIVLDAVIFVLIAAAMLSIIQIKRKHAHQNWIRCRVAAEICRSALATWNMGPVAMPVWFTQLGDFRRLAKSIRLLQMRAGDQPRRSFAETRTAYLRDRIDDQIAYFGRRSRRLASALSIFTWSFWIFSAAAVARTLYTAFVTIPGTGQPMAEALQAFLPIALPLAAGCALSLVSIFDLNRQLASSRAMESALKTAREQVEKCENFSSLRRAVENTENAFAGEFFEWFTLFRFPRFN